ncbi:H-NS histone family protein [Niveibacterium sp. 24ML]|uniref:H-NS histone family protein n=1 Tax=Niveibacterium sp. 24ML TaxID=2985512 RepID=UPI00226EC6C4|nr:H-NS histone family protein [Niveibacterium sp. 24ML]MCX9158038.1 H-NS histone family protein [Niveibacterium sp. 24ML]
MSHAVRLSDLSMQDLKRLALRLQREITLRQSGTVKTVRRQVEAALRAAGLDWEDVMGLSGLGAPSKPRRQPSGPVAIKYRNPNNVHQTWTGRGRQPAWVQAHLASGRSLDALLINK